AYDLGRHGPRHGPPHRRPAASRHAPRLRTGLVPARLRIQPGPFTRRRRRLARRGSNDHRIIRISAAGGFRMKMTLFGLAALGLVGYALYSMFPDLRREVKIFSM